MSTRDENGPSALAQPLASELVDCLEHPQPPGPPSSDEALVDQGLQDVKVGVADLFCGFDVKAAGKNREAREQRLLFRRQELMAPLDRRAQCALPLRGVTPTAGQKRQPLLEASEQLHRRKQLRSRGRELDREWEIV